MKPDIEDRLAVRARPGTIPIMHHTWGKLLFMHWAIDPRALRSLVPAELEIDTYEDVAWIGITPFTLWNVRESFLPPLPFLSSFHELNVRTYVHYKGVPGVWFFSLNANNPAVVLGAKALFHLNYLNSEILIDQIGNRIDYDLRRDDPAATFHASWEIGQPIGPTRPESLEFFLTERYCLYAHDGAKLYRARIHHDPWPLQEAKLRSYKSDILTSHAIAAPPGDPLVHYAEAIDVEVWALLKLD